MTDDDLREITAVAENKNTQTGLPALSIDWESYRPYLEGSNLSEDEQIALIETLWSIMVSFVDLGFRLSPLQEICGEIDPLAALADQSLKDVLESRSSNSQKLLETTKDRCHIACEEGVADEP